MKLALVQYSPDWEDIENNKKKITSLLSGQKKDFDLIIMPEMTLTGFTMKSEEFAESVDGNSFAYFSLLAVKFNSNIIAGLIEKESDEIFNTLVHINRRGELVNKYHKIHPFSYSGEDKNYSKGKNTVITDIDGVKTGLSICYDLRFPELFRFYAKERAELMVIIANWPASRIAHWCALLRARAIENQSFIIGVNRTGADPVLNYNGFSGVYGPYGDELVSLEDKEQIITIDIDMNEVAKTRAKLPFLNDISLI
ncbi:MAG: carbon-nitrogen family hydrolase [Ignavibacteria bacterium]